MSTRRPTALLKSKTAATYGITRSLVLPRPTAPLADDAPYPPSCCKASSQLLGKIPSNTTFHHDSSSKSFGCRLRSMHCRRCFESHDFCRIIGVRKIVGINDMAGWTTIKGDKTVSNNILLWLVYPQTKTPRYYPAEDVKPVKPSYKVKQNVSVPFLSPTFSIACHILTSYFRPPCACSRHECANRSHRELLSSCSLDDSEESVWFV